MQLESTARQIVKAKQINAAAKLGATADELIAAAEEATAQEIEEDMQSHISTQVISAMQLAQQGHVLRATRRLMQQTEPVSVMDERQINAMKELHPQRDNSMPLLPTKPATTLDHHVIVNPAALASLIRRLNNGSAAGMSGWTFDMLATISSDDQCLTGLKILIADIINGNLPSSARRLLLSSQLIGIPKKGNDDSLRPIAIGEALYRLAAAYALSEVKDQIDFLNSNQYGVGLPGGAEHVIHEVQQELQQSNQIAIIVDFANAFNSIDRHAVLRAVYDNERLKPIWNIVDWAYGSSTMLFTRQLESEQLAHSLDSSQGVRQGDPLASLLFSVAIHDVLQRVEADNDISVRAYLDDVVLVGEPIKCATAFKQLSLLAASQLRLKVQPLKSTVKSSINTFINPKVKSMLKGMTQDMSDEATELLGGFIGTDDTAISYAMHRYVSERHEDFFQMIEGPMPAQLSLHFMRLTAVPKMMHLLRTHNPNQVKLAAQHFDERLVACFNKRFNLANYISNKDSATQHRICSQISLPIAKCGFGIRSCVQLAPVCYISSLGNAFKVNTDYWQQQLCDKNTSKLICEVVDKCNAAIWPMLPGEQVAKKLLTFDQCSPHKWIDKLKFDQSGLRQQKLLTAVIEIEMHERFIDALPQESSVMKRHYQCLAQGSTHDWLKALPISQHLRISSSAIKHAVLQRLWLPPSEWQSDAMPQECPLCQGNLRSDDLYHHESCSQLSRIKRHNAIRDLFNDCCNRMAIGCSIEPTSRCSKDGKRPDLAINFREKEVLVDITIVAPTGITNVKNRDTPSQVCEAAASAKHKKYEEIEEQGRSQFVPVVFTNYGGRGQEAESLLKRISMHQRDLHCVYDPRETLYELTHGIAALMTEHRLDSFYEWERMCFKKLSSDAERASGPRAAAELRKEELSIRQEAGVA
jgi:hypothetical protein